jgi:hypothetical protein
MELGLCYGLILCYKTINFHEILGRLGSNNKLNNPSMYVNPLMLQTLDE